MGFCVNKNDISVNRFDYGVDIVWNTKNKDGTPYDLSGYTIQFILKKESYQDDADAIFSTTIEGSGSQIRIPMTADITGAEVGVYHYALRMYRDDVFVNTFLQAKFNINCNVFAEAV